MPTLEVPYEVLDAIVISALSNDLEILQTNKKELQDIIDAGGDLKEYQKIDFCDCVQRINAIEILLKYYKAS